MKPFAYKTYLINLERAAERLKIMENEFKKCEMPFERIDAVDANHLNSNDYIVRNKYDRDLLPGEIACYLSHVKTLKTFLQTELDFALIIEDDAMLPLDLKHLVEETLAQYEDLPKKHRWDVLKLNSRRRYIKIQNIKNTDKFIGASGTSIPITTIAAIWTRKGAEKFLAKCIQTKPIIQRPIDCELQHPWEYNLLIYSLLPSLIQGFPMDSQIQFDRSKRKANFYRQIRYELNRLIPKYLYYIRQHGWKQFYQSFILKKTNKI